MQIVQNQIEQDVVIVDYTCPTVSDHLNGNDFGNDFGMMDVLTLTVLDQGFKSVVDANPVVVVTIFKA
jgi:hypothetical protein